MTAQVPRRPVTARDFNRLIFALLLLGALTVLARLVTRADIEASESESDRISMAQWLQTADAMFVRGAWEVAADAYLSALEMAVEADREPDPRLFKKLSLSLYSRGDHRLGIHFMQLYRVRLIRLAEGRLGVTLEPTDALLDPGPLQEERAFVEAQLSDWTGND